jgi:hypothetical protein
MPTKKKPMKVRDLKPKKDAKGGATRNLSGAGHQQLGGRSNTQQAGSQRNFASRNLL